MTDRTIELCIDADTLATIAEIVGNKELFFAIGYLSHWNLSIPKVSIIGGVYSGNPELTANYWRHSMEGEKIAYQIGAVWHDDHFGFHS
jgi:hypothetical protein